MSELPSTPSSTPSQKPRIGSGELVGDWNAKSLGRRVKKPFHRRTWFRRWLWICASLFVLGSLTVGLVVWRWHREQLAELARQRRNIEAFVRSDEFDRFARAIDTHTVALINYIGVRPAVARDAFPQVTAWERDHRLLPWPGELPPMPTSAANDPTRVAAARQRLVALLTARGFDVDAARTDEARRLFLRALSPHAQAFVAADPERGFRAIQLDRSLQDIVFAAFAARDGTPEVLHTEQFFAIYAVIGPKLWQAIGESRDSFSRSAARLP